MTVLRVDRGLMPVVAAAIAVVVGLAFGLAGLHRSGPPDTDAFWLAAMRLRDGEQLYPAIHPDADEVYRYAPWFALAWVPLTFLPRAFVYAAWTILLVVCAVVSVLPLRRRGWAGIALGAIVFGTLLYAAAYGNPTPAIIATLTASRLHPLVIGVAGSLKVYPLFLTVGYLAKRRWKPFAISWLTAALLWSPVLLFDIRNYVFDPGSAGVGLWATSREGWAIVAGITAFVTGWLIAIGSGWTWIASAALIAVGVPRVWPAELAYLIPASIGFREDEGRTERDRIAARTRKPV